MRYVMIILLALSSAFVAAQEITEREHPRVLELQDKMTDYARGYLQTRLQGVPFMVTVRLQAMRRQKGSNYKPQNEKLPYFDLAEEEIQDEWDDPSASLYVLQSRLQKATVMISLPKALSDSEVQEIKDSLTTLLHLIPGRDEIRVERRSWSLGANFWYYSVLVGIALFLLLLGMAFISRTWAKKLSTAIHDIKPKERADGDRGGSASAPVVQSPKSADSSSKSGDLKFRDPLKTREFVSGKIAELAANPHFPNLQAMIEMDKLADRNPRDLGSLLVEFPVAKQRELFGLSYKTSWLSAFTEPGELTSESIELADRLCRIQYEETSKEWEQLVIHVWRQGAGRVKFLATVNKDEAFAILKAMPTSIAVPAARQAFPGAWAVLLDPTFAPEPLAAARIKEIFWYLQDSKPLNNFTALDRYRQEKDLLSYLNVSSIVEEKDIYGAISRDSFLWQVRPPFYLVLESEPATMQKVFDRVTLDEWALALFNVSREFRRPIEKLFNSKQVFLFTNKMRAIEQANFDKSVLGQARESIGRVLYNLTHDENEVGPSEISEVDNQAVEDNEEQAA